jgi:hypothetical protein
MTGLPPDLARLGEELNASIERRVRRRQVRRERVRRVLPVGLVGAVTFVAVTPGALGPSQRQPTPVATASPTPTASASALERQSPRAALLATTTDAAALEAADPFEPAVGQ